MNASTKSKNVELVKQAHAEQRDVINNLRVQLIQAFNDLVEIGGADKPDDSLMAVLQNIPNGVSFTRLKSAFPNAELIEARDALKRAGRIEQVGKRGDDVILKRLAVSTTEVTTK